MSSIPTDSLTMKHQDRTSAHFRAGQSLNPYALHYAVPFASSAFSSTQSLQHPLRVAFFLLEGLYDIAVFRVSTFTSDLGMNLYAGDAMSADFQRYPKSPEITYHFGDSLSASLAAFELTARQRSFTYIYLITPP